MTPKIILTLGLIDTPLFVSSLTFGVTKRWSPKSLDLGDCSFLLLPNLKIWDSNLTPKSKEDAFIF